MMSAKIRFGLTFCLFFLVTACTGGNNSNRIETGGTERTGVRLEEDTPVLVTTPQDGHYGSKVFTGSGAVAAQQIDASFSEYARIVDIYPGEYHSLIQLKDIIAQNGYGYIVVPTISVWGHRDNEWSKVPNQIRVKITVLDAHTGKEISSDILEDKETDQSSLSVLFDTDNKEEPEDMLSDMANDYTDTLYGALFRLPIK